MYRTECAVPPNISCWKLHRRGNGLLVETFQLLQLKFSLLRTETTTTTRVLVRLNKEMSHLSLHPPRFASHTIIKHRAHVNQRNSRFPIKVGKLIRDPRGKIYTLLVQEYENYRRQLLLRPRSPEFGKQRSKFSRRARNNGGGQREVRSYRWKRDIETRNLPRYRAGMLAQVLLAKLKSVKLTRCQTIACWNLFVGRHLFNTGDNIWRRNTDFRCNVNLINSRQVIA